MRLPWLAVVFVAGCATGSKSSDMTGGLTTGVITAPVYAEPQLVEAMTTADTGRPNGVELRGYVGLGALETPAIPNATGFAVRQLGGGVQTSMQAGWMLAPRIGSATLFARLMFDVISWTDVGDETKLSAFSPTAEIGVAPWGHGLCFAGSTTWDVQFNEPDRMIVGVYAGLCGGPLQ